MDGISAAERQPINPEGGPKDNETYAEDGSGEDDIDRQAVFSPNPMYRPIWSCDFRYNFTQPTIRSQGKSAPASNWLLPTNQSHGGNLH